MGPSFTTDVIKALSAFRDGLGDLRETLLANLVMLGEIPSPTFNEAARIAFMQQRFTEHGLDNCSADEVGNGFGILAGEDRDRNILLVAHADTVFSDKVDHTITVQPDRVVGPGVGDNSLGLAVLVTLPALLQHLHIKLNSNLILMGATRSLGRGDLEGLRFFLANNHIPIQAGISIEGVQLGRLSFASIGMMRGEISCTVPDEYDWTRFGASGAIISLNEVINKIVEIPMQKRPKTTIVMGTIHGGSSFNTIARHAMLQFEVRSESHEKVEEITKRIEDAIAEVSSHTAADIKFNTIAKRKPGGIEFSHPLSRRTRSVMKALDIEPRITPSTSELTAFIDHHIPAITLGLTSGEHLNESNETILIEPMAKGLAQLLGVVLAIDRGYCDEH